MTRGVNDYLRHLEQRDKQVIPPNTSRGKGMNQAVIISEAGLYKLILKSRKKEAQKFQDWLDREVIPEYLAEISANHI
ncbi:Bro-N domain-containing protein [Brucella sp. 2716]|nr:MULTISPECIES: Bro-N domain-containing protein [unclassified Brucella]UWF59862.1 Bro-N domain-containing protein [Brucella sp. 2716]